MHQSDAIEKFQNLVANIMRDTILPATWDDELKQVIGNHLFDKPGPRYVDKKPPKNLLVMTTIIQSFYQILQSLEHLEDIEVYISRFPFRNTRITKVRYLSHCYANHLSEVYIMKERIKSFLNRLKDIYTESNKKTNFRKTINSLFDYNSKVFSNSTGARSYYIHSKYYIDEQLDRLGMLERLSDDLNPFFKEYFDINYKKERKKKVDNVKNNNIAITRIVNKICNDIYNFVFDENGQIRIPENSSIYKELEDDTPSPEAK